MAPNELGIGGALAGLHLSGRRMQRLNALIDSKVGWDIADPWHRRCVQIAAPAYRAGVEYVVRLDVIHPYALLAPRLERDAEDAPDVQPVSPAAAAADATVDAEARMRRWCGQ